MRPMKKIKGVDPMASGLVPGFDRAMVRVLKAMNDRGFDAVMFEGVRSPERAAELADRGVGIKASMHILGLAADVVSSSKGWDAGPEFWAALEREGEKEGLISGADFSRHDYPHLQAVKVAEQAAARMWSQAQRARIINARFA
jgi:hypothetical protein